MPMPISAKSSHLREHVKLGHDREHVNITTLVTM